MNARNKAAAEALRSGDTVELIRLMLMEREELRLHPRYTAEALCAVGRGYAELVRSDLSGTVVRRRLPLDLAQERF